MHFTLKKEYYSPRISDLKHLYASLILLLSLPNGNYTDIRKAKVSSYDDK